MKKILLSYTSFILILIQASAANADVWRNFPQVICIPEMDYFCVRILNLEATNAVFQDGYPADSYEKYGILMDPSVKKGQCFLSGDQMIEYELEFLSDPLITRINGCGFGGPIPGSHLKLWTIQGQKKTLLFDDTVTWHCNLEKAELNKLEYHSDILSFDWAD